jgi:hypothetical protein
MHSAALWPALSGSGRLGDPTATLGTAPGAPLSEGFYFSNTPDWGVRDPSTRLFVDHPVYTWSTPWMILGARFRVLAETALDVNERGGRHAGGFYNPLLTGQLAWDLGNGFGFSYTFGAYFDVHQELAWSSTSIAQRFALSYTGGGWNLTTNVINGIHLDAVTDRPQILPCPAPFGLNGCNPNFGNIDLTATEKFDKWELGPVAFGSMDLSRPIASYEKQSQFAAGWLVGYDFGPARLQAYVTRDAYEHNYSGHDTRLWGRVTVPLWTPAASAPPAVARRY